MLSPSHLSYCGSNPTANRSIPPLSPQLTEQSPDLPVCCLFLFIVPLVKLVLHPPSVSVSVSVCVCVCEKVYMRSKIRFF